VWFLGWKLVLELMIASDVLVLAAFAPLTAVAAFALSKWVADSMAQVLSILVQASIPGIGAYLGSGALDVAARLRGEVMSLVWVVGTAIGSTVMVWNGTFVGLWVGEHLYAGRTTTLLVVVLAFQLALIRTDTFVIDVALRPRVKVLAGAVAAVLSIGLAAVAAGPLDGGVVGLCLGLVVGRATLGIVAPVAVGRFLGVPLRRQASRVLRPGLTTAVLLAAGYWLAGENTSSSWFVLVVGVAGTVVAAGAAAFLLGLTPVQRARLTRRAGILVRRGKAGSR
jgi:O-antigen/teichoic acid export membrane protein